MAGRPALVESRGPEERPAQWAPLDTKETKETKDSPALVASRGPEVRLAQWAPMDIKVPRVPPASMATMARTVSTEWTVHQGMKVLEEMSVPPAPRAAQACRGLMVLMAHPE